MTTSKSTQVKESNHMKILPDITTNASTVSFYVQSPERVTFWTENNYTVITSLS